MPGETSAARLEELLRLPSWQLLDGDRSGRLLMRSDRGGTMQLYEWTDGDCRALTDLPEPVAAAVYVPDSRRVVLQHDAGGNERGQLLVLDAETLELRPAVVDPAHLHLLSGVSRDGALMAYVTNRRNGVDFDVVVRELATGAERVLHDGGGMCFGHGFSPDGRWLTFERPGPRSMDGDLLLVPAAGGDVTLVNPRDDAAASGSPAWLPDSTGFLYPTDEGRDEQAIVRRLLDGRAETVLEPGPECACLAGANGRSLLVVANVEGRSRAVLHDVVTLERRFELPLPQDGVVWWGAASPAPVLAHDGSWTGYTLLRPTAPAAVWLAGRDGEAPVRVAGADAPAALVAPERHRVTSFDGERVPVDLYRPPAGGRAPVVVHVHGGPEAQARPAFQPVIQALVARGFAVAVPNVRGSTGYGKRWYGLDDRRRRLDSVRDLAAVHGWLGDAGLDAGRAALWGGSYGGYMVLAGVSMQPELWSAGVVLVGISNLVTFLENTSPYRRAHREHEYGSLAEDRGFLEQASPLTHLESIRCPLMLIHGANDPRVPLSEATQLADALGGRGVGCELLVYEDEGHGLARLANRLDAYPQALDFLVRILHH